MGNPVSKQDKMYNVMMNMRVTINIGGTNYTVKWNDTVPTTPNGSNSIGQWLNSNEEVNIL